MERIFAVAAMALTLGLAGCGDAPTQPPAAPAAARTAPSSPPGDATTSSVLTVTALYCADEGGGGVYYNLTSCMATASGGTGSYTWSWNVIVTYQSDGGSNSYIEGVCTDSYPVTVTVRDSAGSTASLSGTFPCSAKSSGGGIDP